jgi:hypothetical protein
MKQLLLNFLFFVVFALILVQCAILFPSNEKVRNKPYPTELPSIKTYNQKLSGLPLKETDFGTKFNQALLPFFKNPHFPNKMMLYLNNHPGFYNTYIDFGYRRLTHNHPHRPASVK